MTRVGFPSACKSYVMTAHCMNILSPSFPLTFEMYLQRLHSEQYISRTKFPIAYTLYAIIFHVIVSDTMLGDIIYFLFLIVHTVISACY